MQLIKPSIKRIDETDTLKRIEQAGRTAYKSEDKITEGSAEKFVEMIIKRGHEPVIEFGHYVLQVSKEMYYNLIHLEERSFICLSFCKNRYLVSGNARAFRDLCKDKNLEEIYRHIISTCLWTQTPELFLFYDNLSKTGCEHYDGDLTPEEQLLHKTLTYRVICDRGVSHEIVRHRVFSYVQESTRYCNYKNGVSFIWPCWFGDLDDKFYNTSLSVDDDGIKIDHSGEEIPLFNGEQYEWLLDMANCELAYEDKIERGWSPQKARCVLDNSLKTEIVMKTNLKGWKHFFDMRVSPKAHPQMQEIANMIYIDALKQFPEVL